MILTYQQADYKIQSIKKDDKWQYIIFKKEVDSEYFFEYFEMISDIKILEILVEKLEDTIRKLLEFSREKDLQRTFYFNIIDSEIKFLNLTL